MSTPQDCSCASIASVIFSTVTLAAFTAFLTYIQTDQVGAQLAKVGRHVDDVAWKISMIGHDEDDEDDEDDYTSEAVGKVHPRLDSQSGEDSPGESSGDRKEK